ncbi:hypothetical protein DSO57_1038556, partial [Entomophthora muscae]
MEKGGGGRPPSWGEGQGKEGRGRGGKETNVLGVEISHFKNSILAQLVLGFDPVHPMVTSQDQEYHNSPQNYFTGMKQFQQLSSGSHAATS